MVLLEGFSVSLNNKDSVTRPHFEDDFDVETINCRRTESFKDAERRPDYKIEGFCFSSPTVLVEFNHVVIQNRLKLCWNNMETLNFKGVA